MSAQRHAISLIQTGYTTVMVHYDTTVPTPPEVLVTAQDAIGTSTPSAGGTDPQVVTPPWQDEGRGWGRANPVPPPPPQPPYPRNGRDKIQPAHLYTFKAQTDMLKVGDLVVVNGSHGLTVARVHVVHDRPRIDLNANFDYKWVVDRINVDGYNAKLAEEEKLAGILQEAESQRQRKQLLNDLLDMYPEGSEARKLLSQASVVDKILDLPQNPNIVTDL